MRRQHAVGNRKGQAGVLQVEETLELSPNPVGEYGCTGFIRKSCDKEAFSLRVGAHARQEHVQIRQGTAFEEALGFDRPLLSRFLRRPRARQAGLHHHEGNRGRRGLAPGNLGCAGGADRKDGGKPQGGYPPNVLIIPLSAWVLRLIPPVTWANRVCSN